MVGYFFIIVIIILILMELFGVPVIAVLTKGDALNIPAFILLKDKGLTMVEAVQRAPDVAAQMLCKYKSNIESQLNGKKYPPKACLVMASEWSGIWYVFHSNSSSCRYAPRGC